MSKLKSVLLVAVLALPLVSIGAASASDESSAAASAPSGKTSGMTTADKCCWFFYLGHWYCIPC
jgi:hypothetical protein